MITRVYKSTYGGHDAGADAESNGETAVVRLGRDSQSDEQQIERQDRLDHHSLTVCHALARHERIEHMVAGRQSI